MRFFLLCRHFYRLLDCLTLAALFLCLQRTIGDKVIPGILQGRRCWLLKMFLLDFVALLVDTTANFGVGWLDIPNFLLRDLKLSFGSLVNLAGFIRSIILESSGGRRRLAVRSCRDEISINLLFCFIVKRTNLE